MTVAVLQWERTQPALVVGAGSTRTRASGSTSPTSCAVESAVRAHPDAASGQTASAAASAARTDGRRTFPDDSP
jgi:hypothetical protein